MGVASLDKAREVKRRKTEEVKDRRAFQEVLRTNLTLGLRFIDPPSNKLGPHFAWAFLDPQWVQDILDRASMFREYRSRIEHLDESVFRDYLIHYGMGDLEESALASQIKWQLDEEIYMPLPLEWDRDNDDPSYRTTPEDSLLVVNELGVLWRIPPNPPGPPSTYISTFPVPFPWFEGILRSIK